MSQICDNGPLKVKSGDEANLLHVSKECTKSTGTSWSTCRNEHHAKLALVTILGVWLISLHWSSWALLVGLLTH